MADNTIPRRDFLKGAGVAGASAAAALSATEAPAQTAATPAKTQAPPEALLALTATEAAFLSAAYDTFIPADHLSPSGVDCGLVTYWDRQLAGAYGNGARLYRSGPFTSGKPEQGYQLPLTPREYFGAGIKAANAYAKKTWQGIRPSLSGRSRRDAQGHGGLEDSIRGLWRQAIF
jgi:gluconate 2-dehydrogenase gamma chain